MKKILVVYFLIMGLIQPYFAMALTKNNNPNFISNSNGWTVTNDNGTNTCGNNGSSTSDSDFNSFAYSSNLSGQTAFRASGSSLIFTSNYRGMIHQQVTIPGTGSVNVTGSFNYYAEEDPLLSILGSNSSWIRLDLYNSSNSTFVANLGCVVVADNVSWTANTPVSVILSGGTTYTLRATFRSTITGGLLARTVTLGMDNISLNVSPVGLSVGQPGQNMQLSWTASTAGTNAPGLHATQSYEIARKTSSGPVPGDIINTSNTNSFVDTAAIPNTNYWYAVFDKDTNAVRSPISNIVNILTKPIAPDDVETFSSEESSIEIEWNVPTGGAASYRLERAPDIIGSPGTFSVLASGLTNNYYEDSGHACGDTFWYRVISVNASGESAPTNPVQGTSLHCVSIVLNTDGTIDFGFMPVDSVMDSTVGGIDDEQIISSLYGEVDLNIKTSNFTSSANSWTLGNSNGGERVKFDFSSNGTNWTTFLIADQYYSFKNGVLSDADISLFLRLTTPTISEDVGPYSADITVQASRS